MQGCAGNCAGALYFPSPWHAGGKGKLKPHLTLLQGLDQNHVADILLFGREHTVSQFLFCGAALILQCSFFFLLNKGVSVEMLDAIGSFEIRKMEIL